MDGFIAFPPRTLTGVPNVDFPTSPFSAKGKPFEITKLANGTGLLAPSCKRQPRCQCLWETSTKWRWLPLACSQIWAFIGQRHGEKDLKAAFLGEGGRAHHHVIRRCFLSPGRKALPRRLGKHPFAPLQGHPCVHGLPGKQLLKYVFRI